MYAILSKSVENQDGFIDLVFGVESSMSYEKFIQRVTTPEVVHFLDAVRVREIIFAKAEVPMKHIRY